MNRQIGHPFSESTPTEVMRDTLALSDAEIAHLREQGII